MDPYFLTFCTASNDHHTKMGMQCNTINPGSAEDLLVPVILSLHFPQKEYSHQSLPGPHAVCCYCLACQAVNLVLSQPELTICITKAMFTVVPVTVEINKAIQSFLEHNLFPSKSFNLLLLSEVRQ